MSIGRCVQKLRGMKWWYGGCSSYGYFSAITIRARCSIHEISRRRRFFNTVLKTKLYDEPVTKIECVGHVKKRTGARFRQLIKNLGDTKLSDGKRIKYGKRLTNKVMD